MLVRQKGEGRGMEKEMYKSYTDYSLTMNMVKEMLARGIISEEDYAKIETKICEKYRINLSSFFRYKGSK